MNSSSYFELWLLVCSLHRYIINGSMTATTSVSHWHHWSSSDLLLKNNHKTELVCFPDCLDFDSLDVASKLLVITGFHPCHPCLYVWQVNSFGMRGEPAKRCRLWQPGCGDSSNATQPKQRSYYKISQIWLCALRLPHQEFLRALA